MLMDRHMGELMDTFFKLLIVNTAKMCANAGRKRGGILNRGLD
jgi:hypothetical protein